MVELSIQKKKSTIIIKNLQNKIPLQLNRIRRVIQKIKALEKIKNSVGIIFVDDIFIRKLNKKYLNKNRPTDVLAFSYQNSFNFLGEVIVSAETAKKNSRIFKTTFDKELYLYIIHGILHLKGFDDTTIKKRRIMEHRQDKLLNLVC